MSSPARPEHIVIVGAGPSGLLLALLLARYGIPVTVLEAASQLDTQPRAAHYGPPCIPDLFRAGLLPEIKSRGLTLNTMCWRKLDGAMIAGLDASVLLDEDGRGNIKELDDDGMEGLDCRTVSLPLQDLLRLMYKRLQTFHHATVLFEHRVVEIGEGTEAGGSTAAYVVVETRPADGLVQKKRFEGDYVVGCDGANSAVRKLLLGDGEKGLPGFTWEQRQIVATNTYYPFENYNYLDANFIIHPQHLHMAAIIAPGSADPTGRNRTLWRVTYGEEPGLTRDELLARLPQKFDTILPGSAEEKKKYEIMNFSPYRMHQRLAPTFRQGRFLLAADAAHLCNPFGGLGITGGFVDVGGLFDCLVGIFEGKTDDSILDIYSEVRRTKYSEVIDPISSQNFKRLWDQDPETAGKNDGFLVMCSEAERGSKAGDDSAMRKLLMGSFGIRYDFTQHYDVAPSKSLELSDKKTGMDQIQIEQIEVLTAR